MKHNKSMSKAYLLFYYPYIYIRLSNISDDNLYCHFVDVSMFNMGRFTIRVHIVVLNSLNSTSLCIKYTLSNY